MTIEDLGGLDGEVIDPVARLALAEKARSVLLPLRASRLAAERKLLQRKPDAFPVRVLARQV